MVLSGHTATVAPEKRLHHPPAAVFSSGGQGDDMAEIDALLSQLSALPSLREMGPARTRIYTRLRTIRMKRARELGRHTKAEWLALQERAGYRCVECGDHHPRGLTKDHIVPVSHGGSDAISNIRPTCNRCNARKGNRCSEYPAGVA